MASHGQGGERGTEQSGGRTLKHDPEPAALAEEYAELFRGLDDELDALADSFAFANCEIRESLLEQLKQG